MKYSLTTHKFSTSDKIISLLRVNPEAHLRNALIPCFHNSLWVTLQDQFLWGILTERLKDVGMFD